MKKFLFAFFVLGIFCFSIMNTKKSFDNFVIKVDPFQKNPLSALVTFSTDKPAQILLAIKGRDGAEDIQHIFPEYRKDHTIPILGLYPEYTNKIVLKAIYQDKKEDIQEIFIPVGKIPHRGAFTIQQKNDKKTRYYFISDGLVFDEQGYLRFSFDSRGNIIYSLNGEIILENRIGGLIRYSLIGEEKQVYSYPDGFTSFTHGIGQKPNGNFLVIGSFAGSTISVDGTSVASHRDFVIELDYKTGQMLNKIDLAEIMNPHRAVIVPPNYIDYGLNDWCHINGVDYDINDSSIVVSCRHSGAIKVNEKTKELVWIISPNKGFDKSGRLGNGPDISNKVLTAVNEKGEPFNSQIQQGAFSQASFKWPTNNHNVKVYPNHIITIYDNAGEIFDKKVYTTENSNASIYKIDEEKKTIQQLWFKNLDVYSWAGSSVLYYPKEKEVVVYSSSVSDTKQAGNSYGKLERYDFDTKNVLFSATVYRGGDEYYYRNDDFEFYPEEKK